MLLTRAPGGGRQRGPLVGCTFLYLFLKLRGTPPGRPHSCLALACRPLPVCVGRPHRVVLWLLWTRGDPSSSQPADPEPPALLPLSVSEEGKHRAIPAKPSGIREVNLQGGESMRCKAQDQCSLSYPAFVGSALLFRFTLSLPKPSPSAWRLQPAAHQAPPPPPSGCNAPECLPFREGVSHTPTFFCPYPHLAPALCPGKPLRGRKDCGMRSVLSLVTSKPPAPPNWIRCGEV